MLAVLILELWVRILPENCTICRDLRAMTNHANGSITNDWIDIILSIVTEAHKILIVLHLLQLIIIMVQLVLRPELVLRKRRVTDHPTLHAALHWVDLERPGRYLGAKEVMSAARASTCLV